MNSLLGFHQRLQRCSSSKKSKKQQSSLWFNSSRNFAGQIQRFASKANLDVWKGKRFIHLLPQIWIVLEIWIGLQYSLDFLHVVYFFCLVMQFFCSKSIVEWNWNVVQQKKSSSLLKSDNISRAFAEYPRVSQTCLFWRPSSFWGCKWPTATERVDKWPTENNKRHRNPATNNFFGLFTTYNWRIRPD